MPRDVNRVVSVQEHALAQVTNDYNNLTIFDAMHGFAVIKMLSGGIDKIWVQRKNQTFEMTFGAVLHLELFKLSIAISDEIRIASRIFLSSILFKIRSWF